MAGLTFLQGTSYVDSNANGALDASDAVKPGATIELYKVENNVPTLVDTEVTNAEGYYLFNNVESPGVYRIVEVPQGGFTNQAAFGYSEVDEVTVLNASTIEVNLMDPESLVLTFNSIDFVSLNERARFRQDVLNLGIRTTQMGQYPITLDGTDVEGSPFTTDLFPSYCWDPYHDIQLAAPPGNITNEFEVTGSLSPTFPLGASTNAGQIGYLYNHFAAGKDLTTFQAVGLFRALRIESGRPSRSVHRR